MRYTTHFLFSPGAPAAVDTGPGEPAFGTPAELDTSTGEDAFGVPLDAPLGEGIAAAPAQPAKGAPAKPATEEAAPVETGTQQTGEITDEDRTLIDAVFTKREAESLVARFGADGAMAYMRDHAREQVENFGEPEQPPETGGEGEGAEDPEAAAGTPPAKPKPPAKGAPAAPAFAIKPEDAEELKAVIGEDGYNKVVEPLVKQVQTQTAQIIEQRTFIGKMRDHMNGLIQQLETDRLHSMLDSPAPLEVISYMDTSKLTREDIEMHRQAAANRKLFGNSQEGFTPAQREIRKAFFQTYNAYMDKNPRASVAQGMRFAQAVVAKKGTGGNTASSVAGISGSVPTRQGASRPAAVNNGQPKTAAQRQADMAAGLARVRATAG